MLNQLTKKQEEAIIPFKEYWIDRILRTEKTDEEIKQGVKNLYKMCGLEEPGVFLMDSPLGSQVLANILKQNIRQNIGQNIEQNIGQNIGLNIRRNIRHNIEQNIEPKQYFNFSSNDASWIQWFLYQLFYFENGLLEEDKYSKILRKYLNSIIDSWMCLYFKKIAIVSRKPKIRRNENGRLNSDHFSAVEFRDGYKLYALNGVMFPEELWKKVVSREMLMEEVLKIQDIDQRTQAMKFAKTGIREFYKSQNGKCIDSLDKFDIKGRIIHYELWLIPQGELFNQTVYFTIYDCPSSKARGETREYAKGVPALKTVAEAMSWGMSSDEYTLSPEDFKLLVPLEHES